MNNLNDLQVIEQALKDNPNDIYYCWIGRWHAATHDCCRYDKMAFLLAYMYKGKAVCRQCPLAKSKNSAGEPIIAATTESLVRIMSGERCGRVVREYDLYPGEYSKTAGVFKYLQYGKGEVLFSSHPAIPEADILEELHELRGRITDRSITLSPAYMVLPTFFLSCKSTDPLITHPRKDSSYYKEHHNLVPFDVATSDVEQKVTGEDRMGYSFADVYGKGVVVAAPNGLGAWKRIVTKPIDRERGCVLVEYTDVTVHIDL